MFFECRISYRLLSGCRFFSSLKINKHSGGSGISLNAFLPGNNYLNFDVFFIIEVRRVLYSEELRDYKNASN